MADGDFDRREEYQAATLARRLAARPDTRMVVHAGHGHVFKHDLRRVGRYMAARLWAMTGVEPFTIWQSSEVRPDDCRRDLVRRIGPITEPVMLVPPPRGMTERLFPESSVHPAVDAVVIHPPRLWREPTDRRGAFADRLTRVAGTWRGIRWPVVVAAISVGEPDETIALDQVMLAPRRDGFRAVAPVRRLRHPRLGPRRVFRRRCERGIQSISYADRSFDTLEVDLRPQAEQEGRSRLE